MSQDNRNDMQITSYALLYGNDQEKQKIAKKRQRDRKDNNKYPPRIKQAKKGSWVDYVNDDDMPIDLRRVRYLEDTL